MVSSDLIAFISLVLGLWMISEAYMEERKEKKKAKREQEQREKRNSWRR